MANSPPTNTALRVPGILQDQADREPRPGDPALATMALRLPMMGKGRLPRRLSEWDMVTDLGMTRQEGASAPEGRAGSPLPAESMVKLSSPKRGERRKEASCYLTVTRARK